MQLKIVSMLLLVSFSLASCDRSSTESNTVENSQSEKKMYSVYPGKPAAPVQLDYQFQKEPQTGIPLSILLKITPVVEASMIRVNLNVSEGLVIVDNLSKLEFNDIVAGQPVTRTIQVISQAEGKHYLLTNVYIDSISGRSGTRSFSIPVTTGMMENKSEFPNTIRITPSQNGENFIIQKGAETRSVNP